MEQAEAEFSEAPQGFSEHLGVKCHYKKVVEIPGTHTDPNTDVITETINAWQYVTQREHQPIVGMSGATDANILRARNLDTARVGLPKAKIEDINFALGMNAVEVDDLVKLTALLLHAAITLSNT